MPMSVISCKKQAKEGGLERPVNLDGNKAGCSSATGLLVSSYIMFLLFGACW